MDSNHTTTFLERYADSLHGIDILDAGCAHLTAHAQPIDLPALLNTGFFVLLLLAILLKAIRVDPNTGNLGGE